MAHASPLLLPHDAQVSYSSAASSRTHAKRYLILTYVAEFDRVHYPLALPLEENPPPALLQATIERLRAEVNVLRESSDPVAAARVRAAAPLMPPHE